MTYEVLEQINAMVDDIFAEGIEAERIGRVADDTAKKMKAIGSIRMLQPKEHGGMEAHPREFAETVMRMASLNPSAGWVHGIVGVHPVATRVRRSQGAAGDLGIRSRHLDGIAVHARRYVHPHRRRLQVLRSLAVLLRYRPLRLGIPRRDGV